MKKKSVSSEGHLMLPDIVLRGTPDVGHKNVQHQVFFVIRWIQHLKQSIPIDSGTAVLILKTKMFYLFQIRRFLLEFIEIIDFWDKITCPSGDLKKLRFSSFWCQIWGYWTPKSPKTCSNCTISSNFKSYRDKSKNEDFWGVSLKGHCW